VKDVSALAEQREAAARLVCSSWPSLGIELGVEQCGPALTDYFLSYPVFLGLAALDARD
jgi:hypothetical protein